MLLSYDDEIQGLKSQINQMNKQLKNTNKQLKNTMDQRAKKEKELRDEINDLMCKWLQSQ